ncbi:MAG: pyruvate carboxylase subunit B, partial [ANME-2 cluster archaeon]
MTQVAITDTTLRDAHQSLIATRMRTRDMLPIAEKLDSVGFFSLEVWGGATFDVCIRFLNEDPWDRLRSLAEEIRETPLQMLLRGQNIVGYRHYPDDIVIKFVEKSAENGIEIFRVFDALNDIRNMEVSIRTAKKTGAHVQGTISYTISPVHTIETFVTFATELASLECDSICIKDMAGLISPHAAYDLIKTLKDEVGLPVDLHSHSTSGMAPMSYMAACEAGVDILDTAFSPFAGGTSQPPTETVVAGLDGTPYNTGLDLALLTEIKEYFDGVKEKYMGILDPVSEKIDTSVLIHQIPGGMLSNLVSQLKEQDAMDRYGDVLQEMPKVRKDL